MPKPKKKPPGPPLPLCTVCGNPTPNADENGVCRACRAKCGNANNGTGNHEFQASWHTNCVCRFCGYEMKNVYRALD